jgi:hypothetical protein
VIRQRDVQRAVTVEVGHGDVVRHVARRHRGAGRLGEPSRPRAQQDRHVVALLIRHKNVEMTVAVEIREIYAAGSLTHGDA